MPAAPAPLRRWRRRLLRFAAAFAAGAIALMAFALTPGGRAAIDRWELAHGFHRFESAPSVFRALLSVPGRALAGSDAPRLALQLKRKHLRKLQELRQVALQKGLIEDSEQQEVPGTVVFDGALHDARVRLKGDYTDHVRGDKWSLRIELADGAFLGMRRFSIQDPAVKGFQGEVLYFAALRQLGVLAPRYEIARVILDGRDVGLMAVEEHIGSELLTSEGRQDGVVVHFDETLAFHGYDDYRQATVVTFAPRRLARDARLAAAAAVATAKLRAYVDGTAAAAEVFDVERLAGFLAAATWLGSWHGLRWHNLRFYYDPARQRLEPIGFDGNLHMRRAVPSVVACEEDPGMRLLQDDAVFAAFERRLRELCAQVTQGDLLQRLRAAEAPALAQLQSEYWLLEAFPQAELLARAQHLATEPAARLRQGSEAGLRPLPVAVWLVSSPAGVEVLLQNRGAEPATLQYCCWKRQDGGDGERPFRADATLPLVLPAGMGNALTLHAPASGDLGFLDVAVGLHVGGQVCWQRAVRNPPPFWPTVR